MSALPKILRHSSDTEPGITRRVRGRGFSYHAPDGTCVNHAPVLERIKALGLPPAYSDVWICTDEFGHIQATGRDDKNRKQYRYHDDWRSFRDQRKFDRLSDFARTLPKLRARVARDLRRDNPDKRFVSAALVRLIDRGALRVGNRAYAGDSFGAATLRTRHIDLSDTALKLDFKAKGGKRVRKRISDTTLARTLERIGDLPGRDLFQYRGEDGEVYRLDSSDVNAYIDDGFTAKTFRTWHGTVAAFDAAQSTESLSIKMLCEAAAKRLHNTPAICRKSYIHPAVIALAEASAEDAQTTLNNLKSETLRGLRQAERGCLALLDWNK